MSLYQLLKDLFNFFGEDSWEAKSALSSADESDLEELIREASKNEES